MTTPWTLEQITAAAPDQASMSAAHRLSSAWSDTGSSERSIWGLCRGSGSKPYATTVDLTGPAFRCSCPSRKFPCKHALSLLTLWVAGNIPAGTEPGFSAEWLDSRAEKSAAATDDTAIETRPSAKTPDPATAQRRAERVAAGLDDLERWLTDRVRSGLGSTSHDYSTYDAVASRMIDAQAPGVASMLRALPGVAASGTDWPTKLLSDYSRIYLLIRAYREVTSLPESLARSVHTHLGFPTKADDVRREPAVRDHWQVLATRVTEDNRVYTRKVWLRGRTSGRWAILLDFTHGTQRFPDAAPTVGTAVDCDLHFYPAAAPLRAQLGTQHGPPALISSSPGTDLDGALADYADVLAADPWTRSWPMLLDAVTPTRADDGWHLVDEHGRALPLGGDDNDRWRLLAVAGGRPLTVCGDWDGRSLIPAAMFTGTDLSTTAEGSSL
ncbi:SWIM zinc finger protein [Rhodococcus sp. SMB37]|uniref:SWIM zinc finger family protein n=1 Tax=Rhodococcus sp. SMB37 TaxID=2512213 RepID=UPI00104E1A07|nr:SWIM zinc finger family protein [Rhodococcus sp. SMB37]TCN49421.1 SWIM zinc finger protein [Rhodococcus sp. SMB37]